MLSARLNLPYLQAAQAQKHVTHNEALERLDILVQLAVEAFEEGTPPALPEEGQVWVVGAPASGAWAGHAGEIAAWAGGGWLFMTPQSGWHAANGADFRVFDGTGWVVPAPDTANVPGVGINANFDTTNRLAVSAPATLLNHEGEGHQLKINKSGTAHTASVVFQAGFSGRAEMGTAGSDDFSIKVSTDGTTWHDAIVVDRHTGKISLPHGADIAGAITGEAASNLPGLISDANDTDSVTTTQGRAVIAAKASRTSGVFALVAASIDSSATGNRAATLAANGGSAKGGESAVIATGFGEAMAGQSAVIASRRVINDVGRSLAIGTANSGGPLAANRTIHLLGVGGDIEIAGSLTSSHTFSDFAEMFPNASGVEIPLGTIVTEENGAVRPAGDSDEIVGVVTATAVITAGDTPFAWQGRYLSDEWGQPIMETLPDPDHEGDSAAPMIEVRAENPSWNPEVPQIPRSERPDQWTRVGLLGQVFTRVGEAVKPGDRLAAVDGIGVASASRTGLRCMTITQPFDVEKGYAVGRCLVNVRV